MRTLIFLTVFLVFSCSYGNDKIAVLWTDQPEFAFYSEYFNASQNQYKIEVHFHNSPAQKLKETGAHPDIVAGSWLKNTSTRNFIKPLDYLFENDILSKDDFYSKLLSIGNFEGKQYLLPVSFNAPVIIFNRDYADSLSNPFTIGFDEMKKLGINYNASIRRVFTRMGFSPLWDDNFLFLVAKLMNVSFREAELLDWDNEKLEEAMDFVYEWIIEANENIQSVEDFTFKYFYSPPSKLILSKRILFTYTGSENYFTLAEDQRNNLDFRWLAEADIIPMDERAVYLGLTKKGRAVNAANAFLKWFFDNDTQRYLLEESRKYRIMETSFGISGGFSAMRSVAEQVFPLFYPNLLGHMPPESFFSPSNTLHEDWPNLKERAILPYLRDRAKQPNGDGIYPLENRISDWVRVNR